MAINKNYEPSNQNKLRTYASFKTTYGMENYVLALKLPDHRQFTKLRISSHHLVIETGRYTRPITPRNERWCKDCNNHTIGDGTFFYPPNHIPVRGINSFRNLQNAQTL